MKIFQGKCVFPGIATGTVHLLKKKADPVDDIYANDPHTEWRRFNEAKKEADKQLEALSCKAKEELGEEEAMIVEVQRTMLEDTCFNDEVRDLIHKRRCNAPFAVSQTGKRFMSMIAGLKDSYMRARATDVSDMTARVSDILLGREEEIVFDQPVIVVAEDLTPSETLQLDKEKMKALIISRGSSDSHTAMLTRVLGIPTVIQTDIPIDGAIHGKMVAVDSKTGKCYLEPDAETLQAMEHRRREEKREKKKWLGRGGPGQSVS